MYITHHEGMLIRFLLKQREGLEQGIYSVSYAFSKCFSFLVNLRNVLRVMS